jgi:ABC-type transport system involved in multi-copper enzyme maturation permease subunit
MMAWLFSNPIVERELRVRSRSRSFTIAVTLQLSILIGALTIVWVSQNENINLTDLSRIGKAMAITCAAVLLAIIFISIPAISGASLAGERERDTMTILLVSPLKGSQIVIGKVIATMLWVIYSIIASAPVFAVSFAFGGITLPWVIGVLLYLLFTAFGTASISVLASAHAKTSSRGITMAYVYILIQFVVASCIPILGLFSLLITPFVAISMAAAHLESRI